jgi:hypothetical protein
VSRENELRDNLSFELSQIRKELKIILRLIGRRMRLSADEIKVRAAASSLHSIYNGIEKMLQFICRDRNLLIPTGSASHSGLLDAAVTNGIITRPLESDLRDLMAFRHFYRHSYGFMIDNELLNPLLGKIENVISQLARELQLQE